MDEISPARTSVTVECGEISAVESGFTIGGLEWHQIGAAIVGEFRDIAA